MKTRYLFVVAVLITTSIPVFGWGQKGHDTTAAIAERNLTQTARDAIDSLLNGRSIVYWANWLDNASHTPEYAYTKTWHYKNVDAGVEFDEAPLLDSGDIVRALDAMIGVLQKADSSQEDRQLALKIIVHLLGDIHQPMHLGHASDRGANQIEVKFFDRVTNLHSVWDSSLPEAAHKWSYTEWVDQLDRATPAMKDEILYGTPADWARETFDICSRVYDTTPAGTIISYDYIAKWTPIVETQFLKGGLRLADILNSIFDPAYSSRTRAVVK